MIGAPHVPPPRTALMAFAVLAIAAGIALLTAGADRMVVAAARLSRAFGISPLVVGALVVGFGTSAPELLVSSFAAGRGQLDLAIGNVVGSNTANLTLVVGLTALLAPLVGRLEIVRREGVLMLAGVAGMALLLLDGALNRWESALLLTGMAACSLMLVRWAVRDRVAAAAAEDGVDDFTGGMTSPRYEMFVGSLALAVTLLGAEILLRGAVALTEELDISAAFVGLTVVAVGTSLPELATSLAAARRGEPDLVLGNVLGSNLFNSLAVTGVAGLIGPGTIDASFRPVLLLMVAVTGLAGVFLATGGRLVRAEGAALLGVFGLFVWVSA